MPPNPKGARALCLRVVRPSVRERPREFYHRLMYKAPSSDHSLLTLNLPFKVILRKFDVVFWCLYRENDARLKNGWKFIHFHLYYTIDLIMCSLFQGADFVEFDVHVTKDGCPVLFHDFQFTLCRKEVTQKCSMLTTYWGLRFIKGHRSQVIESRKFMWKKSVLDEHTQYY